MLTRLTKWTKDERRESQGEQGGKVMEKWIKWSSKWTTKCTKWTLKLKVPIRRKKGKNKVKGKIEVKQGKQG